MSKKNRMTRREFLETGALFLGTCSVASVFSGCYSKSVGRSIEKSNNTLKLIHATDTHLDLGKPETIKWMEMLVKKINRDFPSIDFMLFGGDNFNNNVPGKKDALKFKRIVDALHCPWYSVRGNKESTPKPESDPLNQNDYAKMFFPTDLNVSGRNWKLERGKYTILGIDSTIEQKNNGIFTSETFSYIENELKNNPTKFYILLDHHPYDNFWGSTTDKDIHKYVLNNSGKVKNNLFKYSNLILTLSGHKHLDNVSRENGLTKIATSGFVVPQDADNIDDHRFRYIEIQDNIVTEKLISIV